MGNVNQLLIKIADLPWLKVLGGGVIALLIYWAALFDDGTNLKTQIDQQSQQLLEAQKQLKATKEAIANADRFEREVKETVDQFAHIVDFMPEKVTGADLTTIVSELSSKAGLKLVKTEPRPGADKTDFYDTTRLVVQVEGTFSQIVTFLSYLSRIPKLMTFDAMDIQAPLNADGESPKLTMNGVLVGYRYVKPKEETKGKPGEAPAAGGANANH